MTFTLYSVLLLIALIFMVVSAVRNSRRPAFDWLGWGFVAFMLALWIAATFNVSGGLHISG